MTNPLDSIDSADRPGIPSELSTWIKVSAVAVASAMAGGLAAFWFYRKTLEKLQIAASDSANPDFRISDEHADEDS